MAEDTSEGTAADTAAGTAGTPAGACDRATKRVLLVSPRGYCAGVDRAVQAVEKALELYGPPVYVRREIVHNRYVVERLKARGAVFVEEIEDVPDGPDGRTVLFSAHGVAPEVRAAAAERGLRAVDATCPLVTKVHNEARRFAAAGYDILLIGHHGHEEVEGTAGEAPERIHVVDGPEAVDEVTVRDPAKVAWLSQTTLSVDETMATVRRLRQKYPLMESPPSDDICYATQNRQQAVKRVAAECDLVIVVGSENSSNSQRLREVAVAAGARAAYLVDSAAEIPGEWLTGVRTVGLTAGASVPDDLVREVLAYLAERGFSDVTEVTTTREETVFVLPQELRADIRAARP